MRASLFGRAMLPPPTEPRATANEVRMQARARSTLVAMVLVFDVALFLFLRASPAVRPGAIESFAAINVPLLALELVLTFFLRERTRFFPALQVACVTIEIATTLTWIQLTGIVSSYFLIAGPVLLVGYRAFGGYWLTFYAASLLSSGHFGLFVAEQLHVLHPAALFADAGALEAPPAFRWAAIVSILGIYSFVQWTSNFAATAFREKNEAIDAARHDAALAIEDGQAGRLIGATLGGYLLGEVLGRGGMGEVYDAERLVDRHPAAVKILKRHLGAEAEAIARFRREVDVVKRIKVRGVAQILDAGETGDGLHYLAMERLRGEDLAALLRRRDRLPLGELVPLVEQLAEALDAAHALGIVHRDVKPQNIFLAQETRDIGGDELVVKLLDFGVARLVESRGEEKLTATFAVIGTPGYFAPEQISASLGAIGPETDIFALGAVVYRALTGHPAFESTHLAGVLNDALNAQPAPPSVRAGHLTRDVDDVIALALAKRPGHRYPRAGAFAADLRAAYEGRLGSDVRARALQLSTFSPQSISTTVRASVA